MPTIENHAEHPFHFPKPVKATGSGPMDASTSAYEEAMNFPRAGNPDDDGNPVPSKTKVTEAQLAALKEHPIAKGWFHRRGLSVSESDSENVVPEGAANALGGNASRGQRART